MHMRMVDLAHKGVLQGIYRGNEITIVETRYLLDDRTLKVTERSSGSRIALVGRSQEGAGLPAGIRATAKN